VLVEESRRVPSELQGKLGVSRAWFGRSQGEAPGVDGGIYFTGNARVGEFAEVRLEAHGPFDFVGAALSEEACAV
jgi:hypothetical protein